MLNRTLLAGLAALTVGGAASADLLTPTVDSFSSEVSFVDRLAVNTVNGSGLSAGADTILGTADDEHDNAADAGWLTDPVGLTPPGVITFDLGGLFDLTDLLVWNYNEGGFPEHGMNAVTIEGAGADGIFDISQADAFAAAAGTNGLLAEVKSLTGFTGVQFVRITATTNHGQNRFGLAEVRFEGTPVPEPGSLALLGLGGLALLRRRRA